MDHVTRRLDILPAYSLPRASGHVINIMIAFEFSGAQQLLFLHTLEAKKLVPTLETLRDAVNLLPVLSTLRQGIVAGELDKVLMDAKKAPGRGGARLLGRKAGNFGNQRLSSPIA